MEDSVFRAKSRFFRTGSRDTTASLPSFEFNRHYTTPHIHIGSTSGLQTQTNTHSLLKQHSTLFFFFLALTSKLDQ